MDNTEKSYGVVYVLTNPAMPGIVKIGKTSRESIDRRLNELYSTGVPVPFECAFAGRVEDESRVEKAFHTAFGPYRINPRREFFQIEADQAIAILEVMTVENVTPDLQKKASSVDKEAKAGSDKLRSRRPTQDFLEMGIPLGATLLFQDGATTCQIASGRKVIFEGEEVSLHALTQKLLDTERQLRPSPYWTHEGERLIDIYDKTYDVS